MPFHDTLTKQHQVDDADLTYADEATLLAATPANSLRGRIGYATAEGTYWLWKINDTWEVLTGGNIAGPGSSTDNALARWNGAGGNVLQDSASVVDDPGVLTQTTEDAGTTNLSPVINARRNSSGTPSVNFGPSIDFYGESSSTPNTLMGKVAFLWETAVHSIRRTTFKILGSRFGTETELAVLVSPNAAPTAGNPRGQGSVDLQSDRDAAGQVASGRNTALIAGTQNTGSGGNSGIVAGENNRVSQDYSGVLAGRDAIVGEDYGAVVAGIFGNTLNVGEVAIGHGDAALTSSKMGGTLSTILGRQIATHVDTTWYNLYTEGTTEFAPHIIGTSTLKILIAGQGSSTQSWSYEVQACLHRVGATVTLQGTPIVTVIYEHDAAYDVQLVGGVAGILSIQVRRNGGSDHAIRWTAMVSHVHSDY